MNSTLRIATCQFPVSADIHANLVYIKRLMKKASDAGASITHFCESALDGYPGIDFEHFNEKDKTELNTALTRLRETAASLGIWTIIGSQYYPDPSARPYNSLFVINDAGEIECRYDKRLLTATAHEQEVRYYRPGGSAGIFEIRGVKCGMLICHEWRYPELYREYYRMKVQVLFQSWYDGNQHRAAYLSAGRELGELIVGTARGNAANNRFWLSASNTSRKESSFAAFVTRPDGRIHGRLPRNKTGVLISDLDLSRPFTDPSAHLRDRVMAARSGNIDYPDHLLNAR